jgi:hypothetical protein
MQMHKNYTSLIIEIPRTGISQSEGLRAKDSKCQSLRLKSLLRKNDARTVHSIPDAPAREAADAHEETTRIDADAGNEAIVPNLEGKEGGPAFFSQLVLVISAEALDLRPSEEELVERPPE